MGRAQRKQWAIERTRDDVLAAAARAFVRRGLRNTRMQDVAAEADLAVASLYTYFKGKQEMVEALVEKLTSESLACFDLPTFPRLGFRGRLELLLRSHLEFLEHNSDFMLMFVAEQGACDASSDNPLGARLHAGHVAWLARLTELVEVGLEENAIRDLEPEDVTYFLAGAIKGSVMRWFLGGRKSDLQARIPALLELMFCGIGVAAGGESLPQSDR